MSNYQGFITDYMMGTHISMDSLINKVLPIYPSWIAMSRVYQT